MSIGIMLLIVLVLLAIGIFPRRPPGRRWCYGATGVAGVAAGVPIIPFMPGRI